MVENTHVNLCSRFLPPPIHPRHTSELSTADTILLGPFCNWKRLDTPLVYDDESFVTSEQAYLYTRNFVRMRLGLPIFYRLMIRRMLKFIAMKFKIWTRQSGQKLNVEKGLLQ